MAGYGTDQGFTDWLADMGYELPDTAPPVAVLRQRGSTYLDATYERLWTGVRADAVMQERGWPRMGAFVSCIYPIASDAIPLSVVNASYRAGWLDASTPGILSASVTSGQRVKRERVEGAVEVEYMDDGAVSFGGVTGFIDTEIDGAMRVLACTDDDAGSFFFSSIGS